MQGASAFQEVLAKHSDRRLKAFVIWENVLASDWEIPGPLTMELIPDPRVSQFWDPGRVLSKRMGEREGDRRSIVWDWVGIYPPGVEWTAAAPPTPVYQGRPVVEVAAEFAQKLNEVLAR